MGREREWHEPEEPGGQGVGAGVRLGGPEMRWGGMRVCAPRSDGSRRGHTGLGI